MIDFSTFVSGVLAPAHLWIFFYVVTGLYIIMAAILMYHWRRYRFKGDKWIQPMQLAFLFISIVLLWLLYLATASLASA